LWNIKIGLFVVFLFPFNCLSRIGKSCLVLFVHLSMYRLHFGLKFGSC